ncbi:uncharacterized protein LOC112194302 [Rosa chinensis]|uniref:uncharacterized protein LOC112194302 n=1 Tax=Rosa chinensis TaxID=74649 RepID=UPI000D09401A|nr:uncharacterized protein LOC112194302 [Rosa chinensis]
MVKPGGVPSKIRESTRFYPYFKDCIGAIDGTHIPAMVKGREVRHMIQNDALSRRNGIEVPQGKYFLMDCGFANRRQFLVPLQGVLYHLKDFGGQGRHPRNASELFNLHHASLRNVIERIFGIFKSRFTIFKSAPPFPFETQAELVLACAGLHNFLRKECRSDEFPVEPEDDQSSSYLDMEDENLELLSQSQQQQRAEANAWRISIADAMWNDRPWNDDNGNQEDNNEDQDNDNENNEEHINDENQEVYDDNEVGMEEYASF